MSLSPFILSRHLRETWGRGSVGDPRRVLRRFLLLKVMTVLLFPCAGVLPLLVGCVFSLQALRLLHSPHISIKPSNVLLGQLAFTDSLLLLHWGLSLGMQLGLCLEMGLVAELGLGKAVCMLCQELLDAHHLASLLLLALLGLEATLVSRWPLQTRRVRTSHFARLACTFVWVLVLLEPLVLQVCWLYQALRPHSGPSPGSETGSLDLAVDLPACTAMARPLYTVLSYLRGVLWLVNAWIQYEVLYNKPQRKKSCFH